MRQPMDDSPSPAERFEVTGTDLDAARVLYQQEYNIGELTIEPVGTDFSYRYSSIGDHELTLRASTLTGHANGASLTKQEYVVSWLTHGQGGSDLHGSPMRLEHGKPAMFANDRPAEFELIDYRLNMMHFDGAFLERTAGDAEHSSGPLLFDTAFRPTGQALHSWNTAVAVTTRVAHDVTATALLRSEANRAAAIALLTTFPHTAQRLAGEIHIPRSEKTRVAVDFMMANAHLPIHARDVAAAAGLSARSLQNAFQREHGTTPVDYLRRIRLDRVQDELLSSEPGHTSVVTIARRWGFAHLGRFSAAYADRLDEYPSTTLYRP